MNNRFEAFCGSIIELNRYLQKIKDSEMKKFGLRANHAMCLYYLGQSENGLNATQLTELCKEDKAAISRCLAKLTQRGLICGEMPTDKRSYRTVHCLTTSGKQLCEQINNKIEQAMFFGGNGLSDEQREAFYVALKIILNNLSEYNISE